MHVKTDSEVTSSGLSSPDHSRRPVYFVQSPSHDGEKTATSFRSDSPMGSPHHSSSFVGRHSRESSTSRFSGPLKPVPRKDSSNDVVKKKNNWKQFDALEEEGLLDDDDSAKGSPCRCYFMAFVVGFFVLFSFFSFILWAATKPQKPKITMMTIEFERFEIQAGSDDSGVSTDMITVNSTVIFNYRNRGKFFRVHVSSTPVDLFYSQLKIGSGDIKGFYKKRKEKENVTAVVTGDKIPMYGSGASLSSPTVQLGLQLTVRSRGYVLGKLVKSRFVNKVVCSIVFDIKKINIPISLNNSCT